jgi:hypothetical protein
MPFLVTADFVPAIHVFNAKWQHQQQQHAWHRQQHGSEWLPDWDRELWRLVHQPA